MNPPNTHCIGRLATCLIALFAIAIANSAQLRAGLVDGGGDLANDLNNALRFDPSTPTGAIVAYKDANIPLDRYIQVGFRTNNPTAIDISAIGWSKDNITYTEFTPNNFVNNVNSPSDYTYSSVIDLGAPIGGTSNTAFYLRYTLPAGIQVGKVVQSNFLANSNAFATNGVLDNAVNNNFISITRTHTAVPEPTSLMLAASAATWLGWRLRKRPSNSR
jgi:hypothetical protein